MHKTLLRQMEYKLLTLIEGQNIGDGRVGLTKQVADCQWYEGDELLFRDLGKPDARETVKN